MNEPSFTTNLVNVNVDVPKSLDHVAETVLEGPSSTIRDLWFLTFGSISHLAEKRRLKYAADLENYRKTLEGKINAIPEDARVEPQLQIAGQALDDSRYCIEEEELRDMFANLIASSLNSHRVSSVHPSFSKIIQQMSPTDAEMLTILKARHSIAIADYRLKNKDGFTVELECVPEYMPTVGSIEEAARSVVSLQRLGLITTPDEFLTDEHRYDVFKQLPIFQLISSKAASLSREPEVHKRLARLTPLGEAFTAVCLD